MKIIIIYLAGSMWVISLVLLLLTAIGLRESTFGGLSYMTLSVGAIGGGFLTLVLLRSWLEGK